MFNDKTRSRIFWTHSGRFPQAGRQCLLPKDILDFLFYYDPAAGELYRIRENDGRHILPPKVLKSNYFNVYDSINTKRRFKVKDLVGLIVNR
jgi:hypothetical protein